MTPTRSGLTADDLASAVATIEKSRRTHVEWVQHLAECKDCPDAKAVGDTAHHRECIDAYDHVLRVLASVETGVVEIDAADLAELGITVRLRGIEGATADDLHGLIERVGGPA